MNHLIPTFRKIAHWADGVSFRDFLNTFQLQDGMLLICQNSNRLIGNCSRVLNIPRHKSFAEDEAFQKYFISECQKNWQNDPELILALYVLELKTSEETEQEEQNKKSSYIAQFLDSAIKEHNEHRSKNLE